MPEPVPLPAPGPEPETGTAWVSPGSRGGEGATSENLALGAVGVGARVGWGKGSVASCCRSALGVVGGRGCWGGVPSGVVVGASSFWRVRLDGLSTLLICLFR